MYALFTLIVVQRKNVIKIKKIQQECSVYLYRWPMKMITWTIWHIVNIDKCIWVIMRLFMVDLS